MPELPEVETVRNTLKELIIGRKILDTNIIYSKIIKLDPIEFTVAVIDCEFRDIYRYGKYLVFDLGDNVMVSHLRMEGKYFYVPQEEQIGKHTHVIFHLDNGYDLRYDDVRKFGTMEILPKRNYRDIPPLSKLGKEPWDLDFDYLLSKFSKTGKHIKTVLLDQSIITGIGNIYADEVCFLAGISPYRPANSLSKQEIEAVIEQSKKVLEKAISLGGTTIKSYSSNGIHGKFQNELLVHEQKECKICHSKLHKEKINGRMTYYCPSCQKL